MGNEQIQSVKTQTYSSTTQAGEVKSGKAKEAYQSEPSLFVDNSKDVKKDEKSELKQYKKILAQKEKELQELQFKKSEILGTNNSRTVRLESSIKRHDKTLGGLKELTLASLGAGVISGIGYGICATAATESAIGIAMLFGAGAVAGLGLLMAAGMWVGHTMGKSNDNKELERVLKNLTPEARKEFETVSNEINAKMKEIQDISKVIKDFK